MLDRVESAQTAGGLLGVTYVHHIAFTHVLQVDGVAKCLKRLNAVAKLFCLNAGAQVERIQAACGKRQCLSLQLGIDGISPVSYTHLDVYKRQGLGLALCAEIAKAHNGELRFESTPGRGTCAMLLLDEVNADD